MTNKQYSFIQKLVVMNILLKVITLVIIIFSNVFAKNTPLEGTTMQVVAPSGLNLRHAPAMDSPVITIMPYGSTVILKKFDNSTTVERVEWTDGNWIQVDFEGKIGWTFDGFLTVFEVPNHELATVYEDLNFLYPIEFWARGQFLASNIDTMVNLGYSIEKIHEFTNNAKMIIHEFDTYNTLELELYDTRVMEIYQILLSMINSPEGVEEVKDVSIFIEKNGTIEQVKINLDNPISIKRVGDNKIKVKVTSHIDGC